MSDDTAGFVQLANMIAKWFRYVDVVDVKYLAHSVLEHMDKRQWTRANNECINLINVALEEGLHSCLLINRVQFLDSFSLYLVGECLYGYAWRRYSRSGSRVLVSGSNSGSTYSDVLDHIDRICFL